VSRYIATKAETPYNLEQILSAYITRKAKKPYYLE
jgi:hypothetical protein